MDIGYCAIANRDKDTGLVINNKRVNSATRSQNWVPILQIVEPQDICQEIAHRFDKIYTQPSIQSNTHNKFQQEKDLWINIELIDHKYYLWNTWKRDRYHFLYRQLF